MNVTNILHFAGDTQSLTHILHVHMSVCVFICILSKNVEAMPQLTKAYKNWSRAQFDPCIVFYMDQSKFFLTLHRENARECIFVFMIESKRRFLRQDQKVIIIKEKVAPLAYSKITAS